MHRSIAVDDEMQRKCKELFEQLHGQETAKVVEQLSALRLQQQKDNSASHCYSMFTVTYETNQTVSSEASMDIVARNEREATKLYGLVLKDQGILKPLGCVPCIITVKPYKCDKRGQSYKVWGNDDKIYVECFIPGNKMNLLNSDRTQPLQQPQPVMANSVGKFSLFKTPLEVLRSVFGYEDFRPKQLESIEHIVSGEDVIVVMPTGGGKTVIYAIPSLILPGMAVVICPLMMLMCDQVARLRRLGINACYYNTMLSDNERQNIIHNLVQPDCQYQFVFISPEAATSSQFQSCLHNLSQKKKINLFIIDEAHCVDTWGCNFRPAYQQLGILKNYGVPIVALTATATNKTLVTIAEVLRMPKHTVVKMSCRRNNLSFSVIPKKETKAKNQVCELILGEFNNSCGIIYCARQADAVEMAFELKSHGISATFYHAGMDSRDRMANATLWLEDKVHVICCTNAFGMGIDKKGVRFVIHLTMPSSLEDFAQELEGVVVMVIHVHVCCFSVSRTDHSTFATSLLQLQVLPSFCN
ncbi:uncharacterized protein LOC114518586 [Dendronephthya gigantea]|uniref:uncharacterized protein LOC114518586 n=1 Tax=Dendronephthya gigantea TaxID=151771 RepID=UPI001069839C|nr:uncharacterized protein LOC114518586 [Dendronephthya gigantea]